MMKNRLIGLGVATLIGFPFMGLLILWLANRDLALLFRSVDNLASQLLVGSVVGIAFGWLASKLLGMRFMQPAVHKYIPLIAQMRLSTIGVVLLSICAGFGEELFFRGSLQLFMGIWPTAILFVAIHGYLNPMNWRISIYGIFMTVAIAALGYLTEEMGIFTACAAHTFIDIVLFRYLIQLSRGSLQKQTFAYENE